MWKKSIGKQMQVAIHVLLFDLSHKQYNGIIKDVRERWFYCLTSELKERYLINNILSGSVWCLVMVEIQYSLIKKIKIGRPEHSLTPYPLRPITSHFPPTPSTPFKVDVICVSPLILHTLQWNLKTRFLTTMTLISMFDWVYLYNTESLKIVS